MDTEEFRGIVDAFLENGFNYFDMAHGYLGGKSETALELMAEGNDHILFSGSAGWLRTAAYQPCGSEYEDWK